MFAFPAPLAILILTASSALLTAQDAPEEGRRAQLWIHLRMGQTLTVPMMKADVGIALQVERYGLDIRVRAPSGTLECSHDFTLYPNEFAELECMGIHPAPPVASVSSVTAEVSLSSVPEARRVMTLFSPESVGYRCEEVPHDGDGVRAFACDRREGADTEPVPATASPPTPSAGAEDGEGSGVGALVLAALAVLAIPFIFIGGVLAVIPPWITISVIAAPSLLILDRIERRRMDRRS